MSVVNESEARLTDGILYYGSDVGGYASGLRFSKAASNPFVSVVDGNGQRGRNTTLDSGNIVTNSIWTRNNERSVYWNNSGTGTTGGTGQNPENTLYASGIRPRLGDSDLFLATDRGGAVRVTNYSGYNFGNGITYRDIHAANFTRQSTRDAKTNFNTFSQEFNQTALEIISGLKVLAYDLKSDIRDGITDNRQIGFIAEDSPAIASKDGKGIISDVLLSFHTKAIQELDKKVEDTVDRVSFLELENQLLKQKLTQIEESLT